MTVRQLKRCVAVNSVYQHNQWMSDWRSSTPIYWAIFPFRLLQIRTIYVRQISSISYVPCLSRRTKRRKEMIDGGRGPSFQNTARLTYTPINPSLLPLLSNTTFTSPHETTTTTIIIMLWVTPTQHSDTAPPVTTPGLTDLFRPADPSPSPSLRTALTQSPWNCGATLAQHPLVSLSLCPHILMFQTQGLTGLDADYLPYHGVLILLNWSMVERHPYTSDTHHQQDVRSLFALATNSCSETWSPRKDSTVYLIFHVGCTC